MPEGRMLKRVISESKKLGNLKSDSARLLYTWLIPWLDVEGRHSADPEIIKGHIFPKIKSMTTKKIERLLHELNDARLIILYVFDGEIYLQFKKTLQKIDKTREAKPTIPEPKKGQIIKGTHENSCATHENSPTSKINEIKLNESKGKENPPHLRIKFNFNKKQWEGITEEDLKQWKETFPDLDIDYWLKRMKNWILTNPRKGKKKNYAKFINNWLSDEQDKGGSKLSYDDQRKKKLDDWTKKPLEK